VAALLPAPTKITLRQRSAELDGTTLRTSDAILVIIERSLGERALDRLPYAELWRKLYRAAAARGPVSVLSSRVSGPSHPVVCIGFAKADASTFELLTLAGKAWKEGMVANPARMTIAAAGFKRAAAARALEALLAAALAGAARMPSFKSKPEPPMRLRSITALTTGERVDFSQTLATAAGNHLARWLTTLPPNRLDCVSYRRALRELAQREGLGFRFYDLRALRRLRAGAFLAVAQANPHRAAGIVRLTYSPRSRRSRNRVALVGKGICFDTGGINLKPHKSMLQMHEDMQGSAVAAGTLLALAQLKVPLDVSCWLALTENQIGPTAYRPQDVVTAANGTTIQVVHSDAEGRMALADTLVLAARERPDVMIDFATLTGACVAALTERMSGTFTNRPEWREIIELAGRESGERVWTFPMEEDYDAELDTPVADVMQCLADGKGDHILAARFLNRFVPTAIPWVHVDLSASNRKGGLAHVPTDFTGFGVRYATQLLLGHKLLERDRA